MDPTLQRELHDLAYVVAAIQHWRREDIIDNRAIMLRLNDAQRHIMIECAFARMAELYKIRENSRDIIEDRRLDPEL